MAKRPPSIEEVNADAAGRKFGKYGDDSDVMRGRWSREEDDRLQEVVREWLSSRGVSLAEYRLSLSSESRTERRPETKKIKGLWVHTASFFPKRTVESVKNRGERLFHPGSQRGPWTDSECTALLRLVEQHGRRWVKIGSLLNRDPNSVRDKHRQEIEKRNGYGKSAASRWSREEEQKMIGLIKEAFPHVDWSQPDQIPLYNIPWKEIAQKMRRNKTACMEKWHSNLHGREAGYRSKNWSTADYAELISAVKSSGATELDQVPWEDMQVRFSAFLCKRHWRNLIRRKKLEDEPFLKQLAEVYASYCVQDGEYPEHVNVAAEVYKELVQQAGIRERDAQASKAAGKGSAPSRAGRVVPSSGLSGGSSGAGRAPSGLSGGSNDAPPRIQRRADAGGSRGHEGLHESGESEPVVARRPVIQPAQPDPETQLKHAQNLMVDDSEEDSDSEAEPRRDKYRGLGGKQHSRS